MSRFRTIIIRINLIIYLNRLYFIAHPSFLNNNRKNRYNFLSRKLFKICCNIYSKFYCNSDTSCVRGHRAVTPTRCHLAKGPRKGENCDERIWHAASVQWPNSRILSHGCTTQVRVSKFYLRTMRGKVLSRSRQEHRVSRTHVPSRPVPYTE